MATDMQKFADQFTARLNAKSDAAKKGADNLASVKTLISPITNFLSQLQTTLQAQDPTVRIQEKKAITEIGEQKFSFQYEINGMNAVHKKVFDFVIHENKIHFDDRVFAFADQQEEFNDHLGDKIVQALTSK